MAIDKVSNTDWDNISKVSGITASEIANILGQTVPSVSSTDISFSDVTVTLYDGSQMTLTTPHACTLPTTASPGDFVLIIWSNDDSNTSDERGATPNGWTKINGIWGSGVSDTHLHLEYRVLDGTEGSSVNHYGTSSSYTADSVFWSMIVNNIDKADPVDAVGTAVTEASSTTASTPSITTTNAGTFIVASSFEGSDGDPFSYSNNNFTITSGGQEDAPDGSNNFDGLAAAWGYSAIGASTATGVTTVTASASDGIVSGHVALKAANASSAALPTISSITSTTLGDVSSWTINHQNPTANQTILLICIGDEGDYNHSFSSNLTNMSASGFTSKIDRGSYNNWPGATVDSTINVLWRKATGSEGTSSISMSQDQASYVTVWYVIIDDADLTNPINVVSTANASDSGSLFASPPSVTSNGITTITDNSLVFVVFASEGAGFEPFSLDGTNWLESTTAEADSPAGGTDYNLGVSGGWTTTTVPTSGSSGSVTVTGQTLVSGAYMQILQFAVQP